MDEAEPYKIHGIITSDSDSDGEYIKDFDEEYYLLKPPPFDYELMKNCIIKITSKKPEVLNVWEERLKRMSEDKQKNESITENVEVLSKAQRKRRRRKAKKNEIIKETIEVLTKNQKKRQRQKAKKSLISKDIKVMCAVNSNERPILHSTEPSVNVLHSSLNLFSTGVSYKGTLNLNFEIGGPVKKKRKRKRKSKSVPSINVTTPLSELSKQQLNETKTNLDVLTNENVLCKTSLKAVDQEEVAEVKRKENEICLKMKSSGTVKISAAFQEYREPVNDKSSSRMNVPMGNAPKEKLTEKKDLEMKSKNVVKTKLENVKSIPNKISGKRAKKKVKKIKNRAILEAFINQFNNDELNKIEEELDRLKKGNIWHVGLSEKVIRKEKQKLKTRENEIYYKWWKKALMKQRKSLDKNICQEALDANRIISHNAMAPKETEEANKQKKLKMIQKDKEIAQTPSPCEYYCKDGKYKFIEPQVEQNISANIIPEDLKRNDVTKPEQANPNQMKIDLSKKIITVQENHKQNNCEVVTNTENCKSSIENKSAEAKEVISNKLNAAEISNIEQLNDTSNINSTSIIHHGKNTSNEVFDDGFKYFIENISLCNGMDIGNVTSYLKTFNYEQLYQSYMAYKEKVNQKALTAYKEGNTIQKLTNVAHKNVTLKKHNIVEKNEPLHCLKNLSDDIRCYYYEYRGKNFEHYMDFREHYLYGSLIKPSKKSKASRKSEGNTSVKYNIDDSVNESKLIFGEENSDDAPTIEEIKPSKEEKLQAVDAPLHHLKNLSDDIRCYYYEYRGENFEHYMDFMDHYLYGSLVKPSKKLKRSRKSKGSTSVKYNIDDKVNESKLIFGEEDSDDAPKTEKIKPNKEEKIQAADAPAECANFW